MRQLLPTSNSDPLDIDDLAAAYAIGDHSMRVNFVASADGAARLDGRSGGLGTAGDRRILGLLRDLCDVVLVGAGTARVEGYGPPPSTPEKVARRIALGLAPRPRLAVVSSRLDLDPAGPLFGDGPPTIVLTHGNADAAQRRALSAVADVVVAGESTVDLSIARDTLADMGLTRVLSEGGPRLAGDLLAAGLLDELCLTVSPMLVGGETGRIIERASAHRIPLDLRHVLEEDGALFLRYAIG